MKDLEKERRKFGRGWTFASFMSAPLMVEMGKNEYG